MSIPSITNLKQLANFLRCDHVFLEAFLNGDFKIIDHRNFVLPTHSGYTSLIEKLYLRKKKNSNAYREVYSVSTHSLNDVLKRLSTYLKEKHVPATAVHGYVYQRNIRTNAEMHLAKSFLLSVDIIEFFGTISKKMVIEKLSKIGFSEYAAEKLAQITTLNDFLPPGFATSPVLSNMVVEDMDQDFMELCGKDCQYTRYADDLYFSSNTLLPTLDSITKIVGAYGFALNPEKTKYMPRGVKQYVTGLTVFDDLKPRITKKIKRNLRLELHYLKKYGLRGHVLKKMSKSLSDYDDDNILQVEVDQEIRNIDKRITGWLKFMNAIETSLAKRLMAVYETVAEVI